MDLTTFATKINHLRSETAQRLDATGDDGDRREMQGYLRALDQVGELIKLARDAIRLEQQLARKRSLLDQDPAPDWSHLAYTENMAASTAQRSTPKPMASPANSSREEEEVANRVAA